MAAIMMRLKGCETLTDLSAFFMTHQITLNALHLAALCTKLAHLSPPEEDMRVAHPLFFASASSWLGRNSAEEGRGGRQSANILWAAAKLNFPLSPLLEDLLQTTASLAEQLDAQQCGSSLWAAATLNLPSSTARDILLRTACAHAGDSQAQTAANSLWAIATLCIDDPSIVTALAMAVARTSTHADFLPRHASISLWALGTLSNLGLFPGAFGADTVSILITSSVRLSTGFTAQEVSNALWGVATLEGAHVSPSVVCAFLAAAARTVTAFSSQNASNCIWALATINYPDTACPRLEMIVLRAHELRTSLRAQEAANILWAIGSLKVRSPFIHVFADIAATLSSQFSAKQAVMAFWGVMNLAEKEGITSSMLTLCERAADFAPNITAQGSILCLWAAALLKLRDRRLLILL